MLWIIRKYQEYFNIHKARGFKKLFFGIMVTLPHIITCLALILLFPEQWLGIIIVGLILPDFSYFIHMFIHPGAIFKGDFRLSNIGQGRKRIAHILTFIVVVFLLVIGKYILFLAGGIHLLLDLLGF